MTGQIAHNEMDFDMDLDGHGDIMEDITNIESTFYEQGYAAGHAHGELHGLFEGRELGKEKAWELWEEVGYYEGWAGLWVAVLSEKAAAKAAGNADAGKARKGKEERALNHAHILLDLITSFPRTNPNTAPVPSSSDPGAASIPAQSSTIPTPSIESSAVALVEGGTSNPAPVDLAALISLIRARYRLLCSSLGARPRLQNAVIVEAAPGSGAAASGSAASGSVNGVEDGASEGVVQGIEGPMKGVDTRQLRF